MSFRGLFYVDVGMTSIPATTMGGTPNMCCQLQYIARTWICWDLSQKSSGMPISMESCKSASSYNWYQLVEKCVHIIPYQSYPPKRKCRCTFCHFRVMQNKIRALAPGSGSGTKSGPNLPSFRQGRCWILSAKIYQHAQKTDHFKHVGRNSFAINLRKGLRLKDKRPVVCSRWFWFFSVTGSWSCQLLYPIQNSSPALDRFPLSWQWWAPFFDKIVWKYNGIS